ncbi:MAG: primosomal protein N' [Selenomonadaceae bacterium]|nr:primosomal protein N' [Selenomonadaceae bacterium]
MLIAEICTNIQVQLIDRPFTYLVPDHMKFLTAGWRVFVPFGNRKRIDGFVLSVKEVADDQNFAFKLKPIEEVVDDVAWFTPEMLNAAKWLADFYLCPLAQAMSLFMPVKHSRSIKAKFERIFKLAGTFNDADFKRTPAQLQALKILREHSELTSAQLRELKISTATINKLLPTGLVSVENRRVLRDSYADIKVTPKVFELTAEQIAAVDAVKKSIDAKIFQGYLLHGVTGSGKTQVYIEVAKVARQAGRRVIILVPEIALTGQIVTNFKMHFSDVVVIHSGLSVEERNDTFHRIRNGDAGIIIGARSALFTPIDDVGLIVIDEEQDYAYKQDNPPFYHARIVAEEFAKFHNAAIIFGSATPSLETFHRAQIGELEYLSLPRRISNHPLPKVKCVDMRQELQFGNKNVLSRALQALLTHTFAKNQQAILLLNRRGFFTFVMCRDCGHVIHCPECGLPMTYHKDKMLHCHHCDIEREPPTVCPACSSKRIKYFGTGTQKLEQELEINFPDAKVLRMDRDTTTKKLSHQKILDAFKNDGYDILCGTQMVAKGHDIPSVTAVGILSADSSLNFPDFRAGELCFMLITQAAGRAGRAEFPGYVIVQAYNPDAPAVLFGCRQDYESFCEYELAEREKYFYPPYSRLIKIIFMSENQDYAKERAEFFVSEFKAEFNFDAARTEIEGPIPAMIAKLREVFRFAVLIKTEDLDAVREFLRKKNLHVFDSVQIDIDPLITN